MTQEEKHTPGPWEASEDGSSVGVAGKDWWTGYPPSAPGTAICSLNDMEYIENHNKADARLIAAAPDLLEALQAVDLARCTDSHNDWQRATDLSDAALAKALGK